MESLTPVEALVEKYEDMLKSAVRDAAVHAAQIEQLRSELLACRAEREFVEHPADRLRRELG